MKVWLAWLNGLSLALSVLVLIYLFFFVPSVRTLYARPDFIYPKIEAVDDLQKSKALSKEIVDRFKEAQRQGQLVLISVFVVNVVFVGVFALNIVRFGKKSSL
jgi:hypothetical protein